MIKEQTQTNIDDPGGTSYAFAEGKLAWFPYRAPCRSGVHFLDLASGHRGAVGGCGRQLAIADGAILWSSWRGSHTHSVSAVYSASRGRTQRLAFWADTFEDHREAAACPPDLFSSDGHAFVSHAGTIFRVVGSRLEPVLSSPSSCFKAAFWPYIALEHIEHSVSPLGEDVFTEDLRVFRLTDGELVRIFNTFTSKLFLSGSLLAACDDDGTKARIYDLHSGRDVAIIPNDEAVIAILGRQIVTLGPHRHVLVHSIGKRPRLIAQIGKDVRLPQTFVRGSALFWIEEQPGYGEVAHSFRLRKPDLEP